MNDIKILHGAYNISEVWSHRPRRLFNLREHFSSLGFVVTLEPIQARNRLIITLNGFEIFRCSLLHIQKNDAMHFNMLKNIIWAAIEARARFSSAKMVLMESNTPRTCKCSAPQCYCHLKVYLYSKVHPKLKIKGI